MTMKIQFAEKIDSVFPTPTIMFLLQYLDCGAFCTRVDYCYN